MSDVFKFKMNLINLDKNQGELANLRP